MQRKSPTLVTIVIAKQMIHGRRQINTNDVLGSGKIPDECHQTVIDTQAKAPVGPGLFYQITFGGRRIGARNH